MKKLVVTAFITVMTLSLSACASGKDNDALILKKSKVTATKAIEIASKLRDGDVSKLKIEKEDGKIFWDVEIVTDGNKVYDLEIDASSGKILKNRLDKKDEDEEEDDD